jgi:NAD(P)-dependent dehydrogenase (short-subunit alcohol dehydrogenase family)
MYRATPESGLAWVTGASSGIGRAVAIELARRGYKVAATSNDAENLETLRSERITPYPADITDAGALVATVSAIEAQGPVTLAFLNAGIQLPETSGVFDADSFRRTIDVNLVGTANCLAAILPAMRARHYGQIAINGSPTGYRGIPVAYAYGASKAALIHLAEGLHIGLGWQGINVQLVTLGFVDTAIIAINNVAKPLLLTPAQAATRICDGFAHAYFEIATPRRMIWVMKALSLLPHRLYFGAIRLRARMLGFRAR